ncbi:hypothetical protein HBH56_082290 [Parastagonospora nodorum]|uniref:Uncharacterized protein n=1 Tax=Phaeosphaeria nodorum (strain SN15 / ATCC MYA-4574 / FGSC 10173) TaxID=321614 RepID=A0A7U2I258_PHANO|nr:hypothetical protein HBH56_082290 [Parastagonospora nodorum]QRC96642.1 hypothetical protein JI435_015480 [Parastagonospora nodorum SN15]KAH3929903.1 hypothetical protein HBH54_119550 [Parastagonospora nodorum]KAH3955410.1 hypothetical protein HBH53_005020 [Parastagonospora nodorum]KAH4058451.1 hypothetical protein HBH49_033340 [Parastagonospora nodorum]
MAEQEADISREDYMEVWQKRAVAVTRPLYFLSESKIVVLLGALPDYVKISEQRRARETSDAERFQSSNQFCCSLWEEEFGIMSNYLLAIIQLKDQVDHSESAAADKVLDRVSFGGLQ